MPTLIQSQLSAVTDAAKMTVDSAIAALVPGSSIRGVSLPGVDAGTSPTVALLAPSLAEAAAGAVIPTLAPLASSTTSLATTYHLTINAPSGNAPDIAAAVETVLRRHVDSAQLALVTQGSR
jgi:hypothetical protein